MSSHRQLVQFNSETADTAFRKDNGDPSSAVSGRERKVFIPSGGVAAAPPCQVLAKKMSSLCTESTDCLRENYQIFSWESEYLGRAAPRNNTLSVIPAPRARRMVQGSGEAPAENTGATVDLNAHEAGNGG
jgi:hypothetical protein